MTKTQKAFGVKVSVWKGNRLATVVKEFKTEDAMQKWLEKLEESGNLHEIRGFTV